MLRPEQNGRNFEKYVFYDFMADVACVYKYSLKICRKGESWQ